MFHRRMKGLIGREHAELKGNLKIKLWFTAFVYCAGTNTTGLTGYWINVNKMGEQEEGSLILYFTR